MDAATNITGPAMAAIDMLMHSSAADIAELEGLKNGPLTAGTCWESLYPVACSEEIINFAKLLRTKNRGHLDDKVAARMGCAKVFAPGGMLYRFAEEAITTHAPCIVLRQIDLKFKNPLYAPAIVKVECAVMDVDRSGATIVRVRMWDDTGKSLAYGPCRIQVPVLRE